MVPAAPCDREKLAAVNYKALPRARTISEKTCPRRVRPIASAYLPGAFSRPGGAGDAVRIVACVRVCPTETSTMRQPAILRVATHCRSTAVDFLPRRLVGAELTAVNSRTPSIVSVLVGPAFRLRRRRIVNADGLESVSTLHLRRRGWEAAQKGARSARRLGAGWLGCTHSWLSRFRCILICWEKLPRYYLAMLNFACAIITWRQTQPG